MSKILVTGGAGFVGSNLVDRLIEEGDEVVIIDNLVSGKKEYINPRAKFYELDICSEEVVNVFAKERFEYVYHLAAQIDVRKSVEDPVYDNKVNVLGGLNILENCRQHNVKKVIFASTGGAIYGETEEIPTTEYYSTYPISPYGIHKLVFEKYLNYYFQVHGMDYTTLRFSNIYGPRQFKGGEAGVIAIFIDNAVHGEESVIYGDGLQTRDFVYVDDVVEAFYLAKSIDCRGEINISAGDETTIANLQKIIEKAINGKMKTRNEEERKGEQRRSCLAHNRAKDVLNWEPKVSLEDGVKKTVAWSKKNK